MFLDKITKFFECFLPVSVCNLKCEYCYVVQENHRHMQLATLKYSPQLIGQAFSKKRLGGICFVSICGAGETLAQPECVDIVANILAQGHYINVTNNGTMTTRLQQLCSLPERDRQRLHLSFSLHYKELKEKNLLDVFFSNVNMVKQAGCSILVQLNLCDYYIDHAEEIQKACMDNLGALPQVAVTRNELVQPVHFYTDRTDQEYIQAGRQYASPMFQLGVENINRKQNSFCYAGKWSFVLDLSTGLLRPCYNEPQSMNFFENINQPISMLPVGKTCHSPYCINSIHFLALGTVPEYSCLSYGEIRDRTCLDGTHFLNQKTQAFLGQKLYENNRVLSPFSQQLITLFQKFSNKF